MRIVCETIELNERYNIRRNDFIDLLIEIKNNGSLDGNKLETMTIEEIAAQAFVFFLAGFETSLTTLSFVLIELAPNKDIQSKAREEIGTVLQKHGGQFTYKAMMEIQYIDNIVNGKSNLKKNNIPIRTALHFVIRKCDMFLHLTLDLNEFD